MVVEEISRGAEAAKDSKMQVSCHPDSQSGDFSSLQSDSLLLKQACSLLQHNADAGEMTNLISNECAESVGRAETQLFYVERSELCRWNDRDYVECYRRALAQTIDAVKNGELEESESESELESVSDLEMEEEHANCLLLDMTHGLSPFGLMAAKEGKLIRVTHDCGSFRFLSTN